MGYLELAKKALVKEQPLEDPSKVQGEVAQRLGGPPSVGNDALASAEERICRLTTWAGSDPIRWKRLHAALLRIYAPAWDRMDDRDILVAWAAACLALTQARRELRHFEGLGRPLTGREATAKAARKADVSFWGRLADRLAVQLPVALTEDTEAARMLNTLVSGKQGVCK